MAFAFGAFWAPFREPAAPAPPLRLSVELGADVSLDRKDLGPVAILSPDGSTLAFVARQNTGERSQIFLRKLDRLEALPLPGTEGAQSPFFSPDGQSIAFFADEQLKRVSVTGGAPIVLAEAPAERGGTWSEDGAILFAPNSMSGFGLSRVSSSGGATEVLTRPALPEVTHRWPQVLPGGKTVLFTAGRSLGLYEEASIVVQTLPDGPRKVVVKGGYHGRYLPSGHVVYMHDGTLFAIPFDFARLETAGAADPVIAGLASASFTAGAQFAFSNRGTLAYLPGGSANLARSTQWLDRTGKLSALGGAPRNVQDVRFSPDGTKLAMQLTEGKTRHIWVYEWGRDTFSRLTFGTTTFSAPVWTPSGRGIVFNATQENTRGNLYWQRANGTGEPQLLFSSPNFLYATSWHPGGTYLAFTEMSPDAGFHVMILPIEGDETSGLKPGKATPFINSRFMEWQAAFSSNGRWLAYSSNESGRSEVYVRPFPGPGGKWQISTEGGSYPTWSRNGRELFYETLGQRLMVAAYVEQGGSFNADKPRLWSETRLTESYSMQQRTFDLHPDGQRFAVLHGVAEADKRPAKVVLFLNFFEELRRLAPNK